MRQKGNLRLLLNANLWAEMQVSKMEGGKVRGGGEGGCGGVGIAVASRGWVRGSVGKEQRGCIFCGLRGLPLHLSSPSAR